MKRIFGVRKAKAPPPSLDDASNSLNQRGDNVDAKISKLDAQLAKYKEQIKKTRPGPTQAGLKRRAMVILKQKRMYEGQREQLYQQSFNVDNAAFATQNIKDNITQVQAMKAAHKEFKQQFKAKELNIDYIENMQDDMIDMMDMTNEINESLGRAYNVPDDIDESDLMDELDALEFELGEEAEAGEQEVPSYMQEPELPEAPTGEIEGEKTEQQAAPADEFGLPSAPMKQEA